MTFVPFTPQRPEPQSDVRASLDRRGQRPARLKISVGMKTAAEWGWQAGDRARVLIGEGTDHGVIRLQKSEDGAVALIERRYPRSTRLLIELGHLPQFVNETQASRPCAVERLANGMVEIVLPDWAARSHPSVEPAKPGKLYIIGGDPGAPVAAPDAPAARPFRANLGLSRLENQMLTRLVEAGGNVVSKDELALVIATKPGRPAADATVYRVVKSLRETLIEGRISKDVLRIDNDGTEGFYIKGDRSCLYQGDEA